MVTIASPFETYQIAGLGVPLIDYIAPNHEEFAKGLALIEAANRFSPSHLADFHGDLRAYNQLTSLRLDGPRMVAEAEEALNQFEAFLIEKGYLDKPKRTLDPQDVETVLPWFKTMITAAQYITYAAHYLGKPDEGLTIRHLGGTMAHKFHMAKAGLGDHVETHMLGALGPENGNKDRDFIQKNMELSDIGLEQFDNLDLDAMPLSFIYRIGNDRVALKAPLGKLPEKLTGQQARIQKLVARVKEAKQGFNFIEGSDYSPDKFGAESFATFAEAAMGSGKPIIFSPPTDEKILEMPGATDWMNRIIDHPLTQFMTMNETEASRMFTGEALKKIPGERLRENPQLLQTIEKITARLQEKKRRIPPTEIEPIAFVTAGDEGAFYITAQGHKFVEVEKAPVVNTLGAGDAFAGGAFVSYVQAIERMKATHRREFDADELATITQAGNLLGRETVQVKTPQLGRAKVTKLLYGAVPGLAAFAGISGQEPQLGRCA